MRRICGCYRYALLQSLQYTSGTTLQPDALISNFFEQLLRSAARNSATASSAAATAAGSGEMTYPCNTPCHRCGQVSMSADTAVGHLTSTCIARVGLNIPCA